MRRLKKKYSGSDARAAHDQNAYKLLKKACAEGKNDDDGDDEQHKVVRAKSVKGNSKGGSFKRGYPFLKDVAVKMRSSLAASEAIQRIDPEKGRVLIRCLRSKKTVEIKHNIHGMDLMKEIVKMVMEGLERALD